MATVPEAGEVEVEHIADLNPQAAPTEETARRVEILAANDFKDKERGNSKEALTQRWLSPGAAAIQLVSGRWKKVIGIRKARNENKYHVRFAASETTPPAQTHSEDEDWLFNPANVIKIVFGMCGGRFDSEELTAKVISLTTENAALRIANYQVFTDSSEDCDIGTGTDLIDLFVHEYKPAARTVDVTEEGNLVMPGKDPVARTTVGTPHR